MSPEVRRRAIDGRAGIGDGGHPGMEVAPGCQNIRTVIPSGDSNIIVAESRTFYHGKKAQRMVEG